nr:reverse transcriptase domain-containing protein [Tanacetum cinerariifolium]
MVTPVEKRNGNKFCDFHNDKGHSTDECMQLKKQIKELVRARKLSHLIKEIKQGRERPKTGRKEAAAKDKPTMIYMVRSWQRTVKQKITQSFEQGKEITFPPLANSHGREGPLVIEAEVGGHTIHRMYIDGGSSMEILYEHCFNRLRPDIKRQMVPGTTSLIGFSGETTWPLGQLKLLVTIGDATHSTKAWMNFMIVKSLSLLIPVECASVDTSSVTPEEKKARPANLTVPLHPNFLDQEVVVGGSLSDEGRTELCSLLKKNLDIFAWQPSDMTGDCYPLPQIDWKVESLCGYPFKCFLDAYKGYHQIQLAVADEEKTAFHTGQGVYCYTKMPFGLKNAGATYQRLMDKAFENQMGRVKSHTEAEMVRDIEETFQTLRKINMKLNPKKCSFGLAKGVFLGYVITPEGIKPCPDKTAAVLQLPSPQTIKEVQSLNRKLASLNRFLSKSAEKSLPLFQTLKKCINKSDFRWTTEAEQAPDDRTGDSPDASLLYKPCVTGSGTKLLTDGKTGFITGLCSKKTSKIFSGTSYHDGSGAGLILTNPDGIEFTYALRFQFVASNNEAEYEALIAGLRIATQMGVKNIQANVDSKLVANQVLETYIAKEDNIIKYLDIAKGLVSGFKTFSICQVPRSKNKKADALSKIVSTSFAHLSKQVLVEVLETKSITAKEVTAVTEEEGPTWMTELVNYLKEGTLPEDEKKARKLRLKARQYKLMEGILYKRSFLTPWLRCVGLLQAEYVMKEIHEGSCSMHA